jgi:hypothetical protein
MQDFTSHFYQQFETNKANWAVETWFDQHPWMRKLGLRAVDLETHPRADDIVTLLMIRQSFWHLMNHREQACWGGYWGIVHQKKFVLNRKFWNRFNTITHAIDHRQQNQNRARQQIRTLKNKDHNSEAKGSDLSQGTYTKGNNRGAAEKLLA